MELSEARARTLLTRAQRLGSPERRRRVSVEEVVRAAVPGSRPPGCPARLDSIDAAVTREAAGVVRHRAG